MTCHITNPMPPTIGRGQHKQTLTPYQQQLLTISRTHRTCPCKACRTRRVLQHSIQDATRTKTGAFELAQHPLPAVWHSSTSEPSPKPATSTRAIPVHHAVSVGGADGADQTLLLRTHGEKHGTAAPSAPWTTT